MWVKFLRAVVSPRGAFNAGDVADIPDAIARQWMLFKYAEQLPDPPSELPALVRATGRRVARDGRTFVVAASGPSLAEWQIDHVGNKASIIATNTTFRALKLPGIVYGCDDPWWEKYHTEAKAAGHECWTQSRSAATKYGLNWIRARAGKGLNRDRRMIFHGANSGYQAIGLAYVMGAKRILLIGYDMQKTGGKTHWHGDHPKGLANAFGIERWVKNFDALAAGLKMAGVECINCTPTTALNCFERADLRDVL